MSRRPLGERTPARSVAEAIGADIVASGSRSFGFVTFIAPGGPHCRRHPGCAGTLAGCRRCQFCCRPREARVWTDGIEGAVRGFFGEVAAGGLVPAKYGGGAPMPIAAAGAFETLPQGGGSSRTPVHGHFVMWRTDGGSLNLYGPYVRRALRLAGFGCHSLYEEIAVSPETIGRVCFYCFKHAGGAVLLAPEASESRSGTIRRIMLDAAIPRASGALL